MSQRVVVPDATNFKSVSEFAPRYRYLRLVVSNLNTGTFSLQPTASQMLEFKLPSTDVYNLSKSYLEYSMTTSAATAFTWLHEDVPAVFNSVQLATSAGVSLCDLQNANNYGKLKMRQTTSTADLLGSDALTALYPSNKTAVLNLQALPVLYQGTNIFGADSTVTFYGGVTNYLEPQHIDKSAAAISKYRQMPLGMFEDTILGMDRDLYIPTDTYLRATVSAPKLGFECASDSAPLVTTASYKTASGATIAATVSNSSTLAGPVTFSNVVLFLAIEQNAFITDAIKSKFASGGLKFQIPYTLAFRNNTSSAGSVGVQIQMNRGYGKSLKKVMHSVFNNVETGAGGFDCQNWNGSKVSSYSTYINSRKLQDQDLSCLQPAGNLVGMDDWLHNKKFYQDSAVVNAGQYQLAWCHTDSFAEPSDHAGVPEENIIDGLPIVEPIQWQFNATTHQPLNHYTFATFLRDVAIVPSGNVVEIY